MPLPDTISALAWGIVGAIISIPIAPFFVGSWVYQSSMESYKNQRIEAINSDKYKKQRHEFIKSAGIFTEEEWHIKFKQMLGSTDAKIKFNKNKNCFEILVDNSEIRYQAEHKLPGWVMLPPEILTQVFFMEENLRSKI